VPKLPAHVQPAAPLAPTGSAPLASRRQSNLGMLASSQTLRPALPMKGTHHERHGLSAMAAGSGGHLRGVVRRDARRRSTEHVHPEGAAGCADERVWLGPGLELHLSIPEA
jgi:hypothetical protein